MPKELTALATKSQHFFMFDGMLCGMGSSSQLFHPLDCDVYTSMTMFHACLFGKVLLNVYITECIPLYGYGTKRISTYQENK